MENKDALLIRVGQGYDVHRFEAGRKLWLGGIHIPFEKGLLGHSDADVLLHAIMDAMLGALALRDIGYHFPDTDPKYKDVDSKVLLKETNKLIREKGYQLGNIDATIVAERPKLNPHIPEMITCIAMILDADPFQISIKATTNERMGFVGNEEGMMAIASVLLVRS